MKKPTKKTTTNKWYQGSSLDDFLEEEGIYDQVQEMVEKEIVARQFVQEMRKKKITKARMAALMKTSRTRVDKLLDPKNRDVAMKTPHKAAAVVGRRFEIRLA